MGARREVRKQADLQKHEMMEVFERMKLKGKIDVKQYYLIIDNL